MICLEIVLLFDDYLFIKSITVQDFKLSEDLGKLSDIFDITTKYNYWCN